MDPTGIVIKWGLKVSATCITSYVVGIAVEGADDEPSGVVVCVIPVGGGE